MADGSGKTGTKDAGDYFDSSIADFFLAHAFSLPHLHQGIAKNIFQVPGAQKRLLGRVMDRLPVKAGDRVIDIGSGFGGTGFELCKHHDIRVLGVCNSPKMVSWATFFRKFYGAARDRVDFWVGDVLEYDPGPQTFDHAVSIECASYVSRPDLFFQSAARALSDRGTLVIADFFAAHPEAGDNDGVAQWKAAWAQDGFCLPARHHELAEAAGLRMTHEEDLTAEIRFWTAMYASVTRVTLPVLRLLARLRLLGQGTVDNSIGLICLGDGVADGHICYRLMVYEKQL